MDNQDQNSDVVKAFITLISSDTFNEETQQDLEAMTNVPDGYIAKLGPFQQEVNRNENGDLVLKVSVH